MDSVPVATKNGLNLIPNAYELSDFTLLHTRRQTEESWLTQIQNAVSYLLEEHNRFGAQSLGITLTPYIIGQPFRIWALRALLTYIADINGASIVSLSDIDAQFRTQSSVT